MVGTSGDTQSRNGQTLLSGGLGTTGPRGLLLWIKLTDIGNMGEKKSSNLLWIVFFKYT